MDSLQSLQEDTSGSHSSARMQCVDNGENGLVSTPRYRARNWRQLAGKLKASPVAMDFDNLAILMQIRCKDNDPPPVDLLVLIADRFEQVLANTDPRFFTGKKLDQWSYGIRHWKDCAAAEILLEQTTALIRRTTNIEGRNIAGVVRNLCQLPMPNHNGMPQRLRSKQAEMFKAIGDCLAEHPPGSLQFSAQGLGMLMSGIFDSYQTRSLLHRLNTHLASPSHGPIKFTRGQELGMLMEHIFDAPETRALLRHVNAHLPSPANGCLQFNGQELGMLMKNMFDAPETRTLLGHVNAHLASNAHRPIRFTGQNLGMLMEKMFDAPQTRTLLAHVNTHLRSPDHGEIRFSAQALTMIFSSLYEMPAGCREVRALLEFVAAAATVSGWPADPAIAKGVFLGNALVNLLPHRGGEGDAADRLLLCCFMHFGYNMRHCRKAVRQPQRALADLLATPAHLRRETQLKDYVTAPPFPFLGYWEIDLHGIPSYPMARAFVEAVLSDPGKSGLICIVYGKGKTNTANRGKMRAEVMALLEKKRPFSLWPKGPFEAGYVWLEKPAEEGAVQHA